MTRTGLLTGLLDRSVGSDLLCFGSANCHVLAHSISYFLSFLTAWRTSNFIGGILSEHWRSTALSTALRALRVLPITQGCAASEPTNRNARLSSRSRATGKLPKQRLRWKLRWYRYYVAS